MIEIERKFLVLSADWGTVKSSHRIEQGYLFISEERNARVRNTDGDYSITITIKIQGEGLARHEIVTDLDEAQGRRLLDGLCVENVIAKTRHLVAVAGKTWEIDVFDGANDGMVMAEIELGAEDEAFDLPAWVGPEVTDDPRFFNSYLSANPFCEWETDYDRLLAEKRKG